MIFKFVSIAQVANIQQKSDSYSQIKCQTFCIFGKNLFKMLHDFRLKIFLTAASEKSFTKAAALLRITQPSVSQNIAELEKHLGAKLFERMRGEVALTPAGTLFKDYAERILHTYSQAVQVISRFPETKVRISAQEEIFDYLVNTLLYDFAQAHPEVTFERGFLGEYEILVNLVPDKQNRGMFALSYHPSVSFASTRLWKVLSYTFKPTL